MIDTTVTVACGITGPAPAMAVTPALTARPVARRLRPLDPVIAPRITRSRRGAFRLIWHAPKCGEGKADLETGAQSSWAREPRVADHRFFLCRTCLRRSFVISWMPPRLIAALGGSNSCAPGRCGRMKSPTRTEGSAKIGSTLDTCVNSPGYSSLHRSELTELSASHANRTGGVANPNSQRTMPATKSARRMILLPIIFMLINWRLAVSLGAQGSTRAEDLRFEFADSCSHTGQGITSFPSLARDDVHGGQFNVGGSQTIIWQTQTRGPWHPSLN
jgi:hypothetical protein